ncbi:MAG: alpha/beta fold hydrolase [Sphingomonadaceae bacterium]
MTDIRHLEIGEDLRLAYRLREGEGPTILFLPGYRSDMDGGKATAIDAWAAAKGRAMLRFDYSGCGMSDGDFEAQSLAHWRSDTLAMIDEVAGGETILVGSSMGGWLMLLAARARPDKVSGLVGIAAAPDFTAWGYSEEEKLRIMREGRIERPTPHAEEPEVTTRVFWESGESLRLLHAAIEIDCPLRLIHGQRDTDVPWTYAPEIARRARSDDVQTILVKDGDHRLSREGDIALILRTIEGLVDR